MQWNSVFATRRMRPFRPAVTLGLIVLTGPLAVESHAQYVRTNLVSDQPGAAAHTDPNLINAWGVVFNPNGFVWVSSNHGSKSTLYDGDGNPQSLVVDVPGPSTATGGSPTGIVFNGGSDYVVSQGAQSGPARFIWATEDGILAAWNPGVGSPPSPSTSSFKVADRSKGGAVYKGLASTSDTHLLATDFHNGRIDAFNSNYAFNAALSSAFQDPTLPAGFNPFNVRTFNNKIYVSYALLGPGGVDDMPGAGNGFVNIFNLDGSLDHRLISQGPLNSPWGMTIAPSNFGAFSNALLVGNFGDGRINAFNPLTGALLGALSDASGSELEVDGLWGLEFGNGLNDQPTNTLFFAAGPDKEDHGLYGRIDVPEPMTVALIASAWGGVFASRRRRA